MLEVFGEELNDYLHDACYKYLPTIPKHAGLKAFAASLPEFLCHENHKFLA